MNEFQQLEHSNTNFWIFLHFFFISSFQFIISLCLSTLQHGEKSISYVCLRELFVLTELAVLIDLIVLHLHVLHVA